MEIKVISLEQKVIDSGEVNIANVTYHGIGLLRVFGLKRRSNQSIRKEINTEFSSEGLMVKLQYFGHLMQSADVEAWRTFALSRWNAFLSA